MMKNSEQHTLVFPPHPPFLQDHSLYLSPIDTDPILDVTFRVLHVYTATTHTHNHHDPFHLISSSLSKALLHYYPLAATLRRPQQPDRSPELWCAAGQGVPLIHSIVDFTLDSVNYLDDLTSPFIEQLVPNPELKEEMEHPFMLKLTIFKCGGFTLGVATHHWLCDGLGGNQVVNAIAELARGSTRITVEPIWDRERLLGPRNPPRVDSPLIGEFLCLDKGYSPGEEVVGSIVRECFHVTDESLDRFKKSLFDQSGFNFTTFEALGAYVWRSVMKALGVKANEKVKFAYSINIRRLLKPPLPIGYWGNGCVAMFAQLSAKDLIEQPIWKTAELIRKSKSNASEEYIRSFIDYQKLHFAEGVTTGKWATWFMDWRHLGHSTEDFGWGGPVTVLPLGINSVDPCYFLPYSMASSAGKKEGFKVLVTLTEESLPTFRKDMQLLAVSQEQ